MYRLVKGLTYDLHLGINMNTSKVVRTLAQSLFLTETFRSINKKWGQTSSLKRKRIWRRLVRYGMVDLEKEMERDS
jgi:hypothetical protein